MFANMNKNLIKLSYGIVILLGFGCYKFYRVGTNCFEVPVFISRSLRGPFWPKGDLRPANSTNTTAVNGAADSIFDGRNDTSIFNNSILLKDETSAEQQHDVAGITELAKPMAREIRMKRFILKKMKKEMEIAQKRMNIMKEAGITNFPLQVLSHKIERITKMFERIDYCKKKICMANRDCCHGHVCGNFGKNGMGICQIPNIQGMRCQMNTDCAAGLICEKYDLESFGVCKIPKFSKALYESCETNADCNMQRGLCCRRLMMKEKFHLNFRSVCAFYDKGADCIEPIKPFDEVHQKLGEMPLLHDPRKPFPGYVSKWESQKNGFVYKRMMKKHFGQKRMMKKQYLVQNPAMQVQYSAGKSAVKIGASLFDSKALYNRVAFDYKQPDEFSANQDYGTANEGRPDGLPRGHSLDFGKGGGIMDRGHFFGNYDNNVNRYYKQFEGQKKGLDNGKCDSNDFIRYFLDLANRRANMDLGEYQQRLSGKAMLEVQNHVRYLKYKKYGIVDMLKKGAEPKFIEAPSKRSVPKWWPLSGKFK